MLKILTKSIDFFKMDIYNEFVKKINKKKRGVFLYESEHRSCKTINIRAF